MFSSCCQLLLLEEISKKRKLRKIWIKEWFRERNTLGTYNTIISEFQLQDRTEWTVKRLKWIPLLTTAVKCWRIPKPFSKIIITYPWKIFVFLTVCLMCCSSFFICSFPSLFHTQKTNEMKSLSLHYYNSLKFINYFLQYEL